MDKVCLRYLTGFILVNLVSQIIESSISIYLYVLINVFACFISSMNFLWFCFNALCDLGFIFETLLMLMPIAKNLMM